MLLAKGTSSACGNKLNDTFTQQNVNSTNDEVVNTGCENSQAMPVSLENRTNDFVRISN